MRMRKVVLALLFLLLVPVVCTGEPPMAQDSPQEKLLCYRLLREAELRQKEGAPVVMKGELLRCYKKYGSWKNIIIEGTFPAEPAGKVSALPPEGAPLALESETTVTPPSSPPTAPPAEEAEGIAEKASEGPSSVSMLVEISARLDALEKRLEALEKKVDSLGKPESTEGPVYETKASQVRRAPQAETYLRVKVEPGLLSENLKRILAGFGWNTPEGWWKSSRDYYIEGKGEVKGRALYDLVEKLLAPYGFKARFYLATRSVEVTDASAQTGASR